MLTNYVLSFCRITKSSRIFSRSFYLPLLKPLTPREAFRTFRVTGKWLLGVKHQRYIPVLLNHKKKRSKKLKNYGRIRHKYNHDYMYMTPVLDAQNEQHQEILESLQCKNGDSKEFVYQVDDRNYQLVFSSKLEAAIRNGDVIDVLISHIDDKILLKMKNMKKIALEIATYDGDNKFLKGEGATTEEDEKFHHYGKETMTKAKQFEEKEKVYEEWENELNRIEMKRKKNRAEGTVGWKKIMKTCKDAVDWDKFEDEAKALVDHIMEPASEANIFMDLKSDAVNVNAVDCLSKAEHEDFVDQLPRVSEIPDVVRNMFTGIPHEAQLQKRRVSGVKVRLSTGQERFVTGQMISTEDGDMFIPGQTIVGAGGAEYEPGIIVNMSSQPSMLNGLILGEEDKLPVFVPTDSVITADGQLTFAMTAEERPKLKRRHLVRGSYSPPVFVQPRVDTLVQKEPLRAQLLSVEDYVAQIDDRVEEIAAVDSVDNKCELEVVEEAVVEVFQESNEPAKFELGEEISVAIEEAPETVECRKEIEEPQECRQEIEEKITLNDLIATIETMQEDAAKPSALDYEYELQKRLKDNMDGLLSELEQKKLDLQEKLEDLHKLSIIPDDDSVTFIDVHKATKIAEQICRDDRHLHRLADILLTMTRRANTYPHKERISKDNIHNPPIRTANTFVTPADEKFSAGKEHLKVALKTAMIAGVDAFRTRPKDQVTALATIGDELCAALRYSDEGKDVLVDELCQLMSERNEMCTVILKALSQVVNENKLDVMQSITHQTEDHVVANKLLQIFDREDDLIGPAFKRLSKNNAGAVAKLQRYVRDNVHLVQTEQAAVDALQRIVVQTARELADDNLRKIANGDRKERVELLGEAVGFAKALGLTETADKLQKQ